MIMIFDAAPVHGSARRLKVKTPFLLALLMAVLAGSTPQPTVAQDTLIGQWIFKGPNASLRDRTGKWDAVQLEGATLNEEGLHLTRSGWALASGYKGPKFTDRTLIAWVQMEDLGGGSPGGGPISIEGSVPDGYYYKGTMNRDGAYDAIVFGEVVANRWMAGSDSYRRTNSRRLQELHNPTTTQPNEVLKIAITYEWNPSGTFITIYKNDELSLDDFPHTRVPTLGGGSVRVLFGPRQTEAGMGLIPVGFLNATILGAEIHNAALTADELRERHGPPVNSASTTDISCNDPSLAPTISDISQADQEVILAMHNAARTAVGNPKLVWDDGLARHAQGWANVIAESNRLKAQGQPSNLPGSMGVHSDLSCYSKTYGSWPESISSGSATTQKAIQMWIDEQNNWIQRDRMCMVGEVCGHYLQLVASFVTKVGCGHNANSSWVCSYNTFGAQLMRDGTYREPYVNP